MPKKKRKQSNVQKRNKIVLPKYFIVLSVALVAFIILLFCIQSFVGKTTPKKYAVTPEMKKLSSQNPPPGTLVDVGGFKMHIHCMGTGSPTVIFESGNADNSLTWSTVAPVIAQKTRVCTYDRAGHGWSQTNDKPYSLKNNVHNVHTLLGNAGVKPPYLLVAHSMGGIYVRNYYQKYPNEVVGMVLVDPSAEKVETVLDKKTSDEMNVLTEQSITELEDLLVDIKSGKIAANISQLESDPRYSKKDGDAAKILIATNPLEVETRIKELKNASTIFSQARASNLTNLGNIPLILLASDNKDVPDSDTMKSMYTMWHELQKEIANQSTRGVYRKVPNTTHFIQLDKPEEVNQAIMEVLNAVQ